MKKSNLFLFLMVVSFAITSCKKTVPAPIPVQSSLCNNPIPVDTFIANNYSQDAVALYLFEIDNDTTNKNYNNPILDTSGINKVLDIIQAVYNSSSKQRDTVFTKYRIHSSLSSIVNYITIGANMDAPEMKNLSKGIIPTGLPALDSILMKYSFDSVSVYTSYISLYTPHIYNLIPIGKQLAAIPSIFSVETNHGVIGQPSLNMGLASRNDTAYLSFFYGSGDCPSGCITGKTWLFTVECNEAQFSKTIQY